MRPRLYLSWLASLLFVFALFSLTSLQPALAQTAPVAVGMAVGGDSLTRLLWNNPDGSASLWRINSDNSVTTYTYGPYSGFSGASVAVGSDNGSRILWKQVLYNEIALWGVDNQGNITSNQYYYPDPAYNSVAVALGPNNIARLLLDKPDGTMSLWNTIDPQPQNSYFSAGPYTNYTATGLAVGTDNQPCILWNNTDNSLALWRVNSPNNTINYGYAGPYGGYTVTAMTVDASNSPRILWNHPSDNTISLWKVAPNYSSSLAASATNFYYNDPPGFLPKALAGGPDGKVRLLWTKPDGTVQVWTIDASGNYTPATYSPYVNGLRIDAGSNAAYTDSRGARWAADYGSSGGLPPTTSAAITGTSDPALYQTQRVGASFSYALSVPNGKYVLGLSFAETGGSTTGQRVFTVAAGNRILLDHFDIFASGGANTALTRGFLVKVTGGQITLTFTGNTGNAALAALSLAPIPQGGGILPSLLGQSDAVPDIPEPDWAGDAVPADDASDADGEGPAASGSTNLASGAREDNPGPDLWAYNPVGPTATYERLYRSVRASQGYGSPGLSIG